MPALNLIRFGLQSNFTFLPTQGFAHQNLMGFFMPLHPDKSAKSKVIIPCTRNTIQALY